MSNLDQEIIRREDGSIDVGHYVALARRERAGQAATLKSAALAKVRMLVSGVRAATKIGLAAMPAKRGSYALLLRKATEV